MDDLLNNREELFKNGVSQGTYAHDSTNAYTSVLGTPVSHDDAGNLTKDHRGYSYEYDYENKITRIYEDNNTSGIYDTGDTNIAEYTYDALGRRIERFDAVANVTTCFYYDDQRVIYEAETRPEGLEERVFVYGNYIDEVLVMRRKEAGSGGWSQYFYGHDHLYSPTVLFLWYGMVMERYEYDAYGKVHVMDAGYNSLSESAFRNPVAFTGRTLDRLNGGSLEIMYYRARYYDPETGRFMQRDPLGIDPSGGTQNPFNVHKQYIDGMNIYEYVKDNPVVGFDPWGTEHTYEWGGLNWSAETCIRCRFPNTWRNFACIARSASKSCDEVSSHISDPVLAKCIKKKCRKSFVRCSTAKPKNGDVGNSSGLGIVIWVNQFDKQGEAGGYTGGDVIIHEFAEDCGWKEGQGKGVPDPKADAYAGTSSWGKGCD